MAKKMCKSLTLFLIAASISADELDHALQSMAASLKQVVLEAWGGRTPLAGMHKRSEITQSLIGISASELDARYASKELKDARFIASLFERGGTPDRPLYFINSPDGIHRFQAGYFEEHALSDLQRRHAAQLNIGKKTVVTLLYGGLDIGFLQSLPQFNGALFQAASNFSALEPTSRFATPESLSIDRYYNDLTQGPMASISATPGLFYRMYGIFQQEGPSYSNRAQSFYGAQSPFDWRQTANRQIELLSETGIPVLNGYIDLNDQYLSTRVGADLMTTVLPTIKVGIHRDIQVLFSDQGRGAYHEPLSAPDQIIHQLFTAAVDVTGNRAFFTNQTTAPQAEKVARLVLRAAYEGALYAALELKIEKVVLTLIGGGVFANPPEWVLTALYEALEKFSNAGLEVYINFFTANQPSDLKGTVDALKARAIEASVATIPALSTNKPQELESSLLNRLWSMIGV